MSFSITTANSELEGMLHGTTTNKIQNLFGVYNRAARQLLLDVDPQETIRRSLMSNPIYDHIYDYVIPSDVKGNKIIDIRPQVNRSLRDRFLQNFNQQFDLTKEYVFSPSFTIDFNTGIKTLRVNYPLVRQGITINTADGITDNGTWTAGGDATNLRVDNINFVSTTGSLAFDLNASGSSGYLENSTMGKSDLTAHQNQSTLFLWVYLPTGTDFTSIGLRWGSDASNYWTGSATTTFEGNAFNNGWNLIGIPWLGATQINSPVVSSVNYLRITYNYDGNAQTACHLNNVISNMGELMEIEYYSKFIFRNASTSAWQETVLTNNDLINLDTESYNLFLFLAADYATQQLLDVNTSMDINVWETKYQVALARYKSLYKSQVQKPRETYYTPTYIPFRDLLHRRW